MRKIVTMPDNITYDMVKAAMRELGLAGGTFSVTMSTGEVVVSVTVPGAYGSLTRTYEVGNWAISYQPAGADADGAST